MGWAVKWWGLLEGKALRDGLLKLDSPNSLLDFPPRLFLAYAESLIRDDEELAEELDKLYTGPVKRDEHRMRDIMAALGAL